MKLPRIGQSAGKAYAYILGLYMGDGCVSRQPKNGSHRFRLNVIDEDFAEHAMDQLEELFGRRTKIFIQNERFYTFSVGCKELCDHLQEVTGKKGKIPEFVMDWPRELKQRFIEAQMDSDGYVVRYKGKVVWMGFKNCDPWFDDFKQLLKDVGIKTGKTTIQKGVGGRKDAKKITINMASWVDSGFHFSCARKQSRIEEYKRLNPHRLIRQAAA